MDTKDQNNIENIEDIAREEKLNELEILKQSLEQIKKQADDNYDKFVRLNAEFVNFKNRTEKEKLEFFKYANKDLFKEFLTFIDSFESALKNDQENKSLKILFDSLMELLKKQGLEKIKAVGEKFDHNLHDAVGFDNNPNFENDFVTFEMQTGYKLKDKVLRHSMVKVNKKN